MAEILGRQIEIGLALETTKGTAKTTAQRWLKHVTAGVVSRVEKVTDDSVRGVLEDSEGARVAKKWFDGDVEGILHIDAIGYLLANIYGTVSSGSAVTGTYLHDITLAQSINHISLTLFRKDGSATQKIYGGGIINTLELTASPDDYIRFTANVICANEASNASSPSYSTESDFIGRDVTIKIASSEAGLSAAPALNCKEVTISWDTGAISDFTLGSFSPVNYNAKMGIEVDITKNFFDTVFEDLFKTETYRYVEIKIIGEASIGSGSVKPTLVLLLNRAQVIEWDREAGADDLSTETIKLKAFYNAADAQQSSIKLTNVTSAYVAV